MRRAGGLTGEVRALILLAVVSALHHLSFPPSIHEFVDHNRLGFDPASLQESHQPPAQVTRRTADVRIG